MTERSFQMRLFCRYAQPDNAVADLKVEVLADGQWKDFDLNPETAGFLILVYAIFSCQHLYLRTNCAEQGLLLDSAEGAIELVASEDWEVQKLHINFEIKLKSVPQYEGDLGYIIERMKQCPVSRNLRPITDSETVVRLA